MILQVTQEELVCLPSHQSCAAGSEFLPHGRHGLSVQSLRRLRKYYFFFNLDMYLVDALKLGSCIEQHLLVVFNKPARLNPFQKENLNRFVQLVSAFVVAF